jgi:pimeloyl-ACP methyl ester carboxylesterase
MVETIGLTTRSGLTFTANAEGPVGGPLVLLLHGFPESRHSWREALPVLAAAG